MLTRKEINKLIEKHKEDEFAEILAEHNLIIGRVFCPNCFKFIRFAIRFTTNVYRNDWDQRGMYE